MSSKSPIFPMLEPHHYSDYGFDPQIDFFQVLGEARRHKRESASSSASSRSIDSIHFKLQKPISKDDHHHPRRSLLKKRKWWRNALLFFRGRWSAPQANTATSTRRCTPASPSAEDESQSLHIGTPVAFRASISGPVYLADSRSGSYRTTNRPSSGPLAGTLLSTPRKGGVTIPYLSLRELNMEEEEEDYHQSRRMSTSAAMPIYLVT